MDKTVYKVLALKELLDKVYVSKTNLPAKALISRTKALHSYAVTPDSISGEEEPAFEDFMNARDYYKSFANYKFIVEQTPILNMNNGYEVRVYRDIDTEPSFKFITEKIW